MFCYHDRISIDTPNSFGRRATEVTKVFNQYQHIVSRESWNQTCQFFILSLFLWYSWFVKYTWFKASYGLQTTASAWVEYYTTGVQIVICTLSDESVLSESTGLFNPVLCVSQWYIFWQKIGISDCVFQIRLRLEQNYSPLHLVVTLTGFLKAWLENYSNYDIEICFFF